MRRSSTTRAAACITAAVLAVISLASTTAVAVAPHRTLPPANAKWDYQIGPAYTPRHGVKLVSRDREATPAAGLYNNCYVNAYQTQPSETRWWKRHHNNLLLQKAGGGYVVDSYWGEVLLDMSTAAKRAAIAKIVNRWINGCAADGFDAVEPDNLDSWTRSGGRLTKGQAFAFAALIIKHAHSQGLAIAQKNAAGQTALGKATGFDFAVAEECGRYNECGAYTSAYGAQVYVIEYRNVDFAKSCRKWGDQLSIVRRDRNVSGPSSNNYVYHAC